MWRRLRNLFTSLRTYADLGPDLGQRQRINQALHQRPFRSAEEWYTLYWKPLAVSREVTKFVYLHLEQYSGLQVARVLPSDRLNEDLHLPLVCWFDWQLDFCEEFECQFGVDITGCFDPGRLETIAELVLFLHQQVLSLKAVSRKELF